MGIRHAKHIVCAGLACTMIAAGSVQSQEADQRPAPSTPSSSNIDLNQIKQELADQARALEAQRAVIAEQEKKLAAQKQELEQALRRLEAMQAQIDGKAPKTAEASKETQPDEKVSQTAKQDATGTQVAQTQPVGQRPPKPEVDTAPAVAPIFDQPGVLTPRDNLIVEPSLQYSYSSNYQVALVGYTIIPAIHIGLIDIRGVNNSTWIAALTARYGLTNRLEVEAKVPYVYREQSSVTRPLGVGAAQESVFDADGYGIGDIELAMRYQFEHSGGNEPYYIAGLRIKSRTGKDPFDIPFKTLPGGQQMPGELATGSGFWAIQPSFSLVYPTDPAVLFGGANFTWNIERDVGGGRGTVHPGNAVGLNIGMGIALNERTSFSLGFEHTWVEKPSATGGSLAFPAATSVQLATLMTGFSYRLTDKTSVNLSVGAGLTEDTPDVQVTLRVPFTY